MRDELAAALLVAAADASITHVELSGTGPSFCSGGDLTEFGTSDDPVLAHLVRTTRSPAALLATVAERTVALVHGSCVGAGVELPAFAGRVVADPDATFRLPEVAMGLIPGAGGTVSLPRRIGRSRATYLAISGQPIEATTALAWGLVDEITRRAR
jgi:enoyl-CoA hydratase/carnithine racemase